jgi:NADP-reducing hydrogenase subunit HndC
LLSHCGLGQTAGLPTRDILNHYRAEAEAHVRLKVCPTGICGMGR